MTTSEWLLMYLVREWMTMSKERGGVEGCVVN